MIARNFLLTVLAVALLLSGTLGERQGLQAIDAVGGLACGILIALGPSVLAWARGNSLADGYHV